MALYEDVAVGVIRPEKVVIASSSTIPSTVSLSVGTVGASTCTVTGTVKDGHGVQLKETKLLRVYLSSDAAGTTPSSAPNGGIAIASLGTIVHTHTANVYVEVLTSSAGTFDLTLTESGTASFYVNVVSPASGNLITSSVIAFS